MRLTRSYYCSLLSKIGDREIPIGPMNAIILGLKIILILLVWLFVWYTLFLAFHWFNSIDLRTLYTLIGCYIILVSWFPLQLYAEWYQWYGDLSHVLLYYTFWVLFVVALLLIALFAVWVVVLIEKANLITAVAALQSIVITVFGALFYFKPEAIDKMFGVFERLPSPLVIVLMFILLLYIAIYVHLILVFSTGNAVLPARPDRR